MPVYAPRRIDSHGHRIRRPEPILKVSPMSQQDLYWFHKRNSAILYSELFLSEFKATEKNYIASIFLTGTKDLYGNWKGTVNIGLIEKWAESLGKTGLTGIMFHNCFSENVISSFSKYPVIFIRVSIPPNHMSGLWRYEIYDHFLTLYGEKIENIFFTDSTDLDVLRNPVIDSHYEKDKIYIGNEIGNKNHKQAISGTKWMIEAAIGYEKYTALAKSDKEFYNQPLLNAGLVGGNMKAIRVFMKRMAEECNSVYPVAAVQDMPIINYLAYEFKDKVHFSEQVNTVFNSFEQNNKTAWFRHK